MSRRIVPRRHVSCCYYGQHRNRGCRVEARGRPIRARFHSILIGVLALASSWIFVALGVSAAAGGAAGGVVSARASRQEQHPPAIYAETVLANVVYVPAKALFAASGAVTSGVTYLVTAGSREPGVVWRSAVDGDYVLTPDMIEGNDPVHFVGASTTRKKA